MGERDRLIREVVLGGTALIAAVAVFAFRGIAIACVLASSTLLIGCGGNEEVPPPDADESAVQIVQVVNEFFEAATTRQGTEACEHLTDFGRQVLVKVLRGETEGKSPGVRQYDPEECAEAVEEPAIELGDRPVSLVRQEQVTVSPGGRSATVAQGSSGNELALKFLDGRWQIVVPIFTGR